MCGHVGIAGKLEFKDEKTFKRLLIYDFFRGPDSTGVATLRNDGGTRIVKLASHPVDLFGMKKFDEAMNGYQSSVFLGHNRLATKGAVNGANAHPYQYGHIIGAHNGTLDKSSWDKLDELTGEKHDVDSQALIHAIAALGIEETVKHLSGAWALVWINLEDGTLNFLRNKERPFWISYDKKFERLFWASEWPMIDCAVKMADTANSYELYHDSKGHKFFATEIDWWYRYDLKQLRAGSTVRPKPRAKELKGKEPTPVVSYHSGVSPFGRTTNQVTSHGTTTGASTTVSTISSTGSGGTVKDVDVIDLVGNAQRPLAGVVSEDEFFNMAKFGCAWCGEPLGFGTVGVSVYEKEEVVVCPKCTGNHGHSRIYLEDLANAA